MYVREPSHDLTGQEIESIPQSAEMATNALRSFLKRTREEKPGIFPNLTDSLVGYLAHDIAKMQLQLIKSLKVKYRTSFCVIDPQDEAYTRRMSDTEIRVSINCHFLDRLAQMISNGKEYRARALLRSALAHESYHAYAEVRYPHSSELSYKVTGKGKLENGKYLLDKGEQAAFLYSIQHLRAQSEEVPLQKKANVLLAQEEETILKDKLPVYRLIQKVRSMFRS